jgi:hypothetical protein
VFADDEEDWDNEVPVAGKRNSSSCVVLFAFPKIYIEQQLHFVIDRTINLTYKMRTSTMRCFNLEQLIIN